MSRLELLQLAYIDMTYLLPAIMSTLIVAGEVSVDDVIGVEVGSYIATLRKLIIVFIVNCC